MNCQQVRIASSIQRKRRHLRPGNDFTKMSRGGIDLRRRIAADDHGVRVRADGEGRYPLASAESVSTVRSVFRCGAKSVRGDGEIVVANGEVGEGIQALLIGHDVIGRMLRRVDQLERRTRLPRRRFDPRRCRRCCRRSPPTTRRPEEQKIRSDKELPDSRKLCGACAEAEHMHLE